MNPYVYNYIVNRDLKLELKRKEIKYKELATALGYSVQSINMWMCQPLDGCHERMIRRGIAKIEEQRQGTT